MKAIKGALAGVMPILLLGGLVFVGYGDKMTALPPQARQVSTQVRQSVTQLLVRAIPREGPEDGRYERSWDVVDTFDSKNQGRP
ncbi:MAG: hypothetical protein Q6K99_04375 [Thermostichales cyanobacterium BF4_bins_65]